jgi:curved DNA-binding protein CbpA
VTANRYQDFVFSPADLAEDVDLPLDRRKEILYVDAHLSTWTHFQTLGLPWNAPADDVRVAYLEKAKTFHPDRYPGKRLGTYRVRLEKIFRRLTEARDTLQDEARRSDYLRKAAPPDEFARVEVRRIENDMRAEERRSRLARNNPLVARVAKVTQMVNRGRRLMDEGRFAQAANDFCMAASLDPRNAEIRALADEARRRAEVGRGKEASDRGIAAEALGNWGLALECYQEATRADPGNGRYAIQAARAALQAGDLGSARALAEVAVQLASGSGAAHEALGMVLEAQGEGGPAKKTLQRALELDPGLETARARLKKMRWSLLG